MYIDLTMRLFCMCIKNKKKEQVITCVMMMMCYTIRLRDKSKARTHIQFIRHMVKQLLSCCF